MDIMEMLEMVEEIEGEINEILEAAFPKKELSDEGLEYFRELIRVASHYYNKVEPTVWIAILGLVSLKCEKDLLQINLNKMVN